MKRFGIIGDPIAHSLSPRMQRAAFKKARISASYQPFRVSPRELRRFVKSAEVDRLAGFNVTIPHKETILPLLDSVDREAREIGAVNTVVIRKGRMIGYNTDARGFLQSLHREARFRCRGKEALILGAGGAARAVLTALVSAGIAAITVANRTPRRAERLAQRLRRRLPIRIVSLRRKDLGKILPRIDLLVNATAVGLGGSRFRGLPLRSLKKTALVSDLVYRPRWTPLLLEARRLGFKTHSGLGMLLHQGALSFRLWTGRPANLAAMRKALP